MDWVMFTRLGACSARGRGGGAGPPAGHVGSPAAGHHPQTQARPATPTGPTLVLEGLRCTTALPGDGVRQP
eukprot:10725749-Alexandrium_andersonii.AAC.1